MGVGMSTNKMRERIDTLLDAMYTTLLILGLIWVCLALSFDIVMIYAHFFNEPLQDWIVDKLDSLIY